MRHELRTFAQCMETKLKQNDHKGGWENLTYAELFDKLRGEVDELEAAIAAEPTLNVVFEAADVANFAMMIAWNALREMVHPKDDTIHPDYFKPTQEKGPCEHNHDEVPF